MSHFIVNRLDIAILGLLADPFYCVPLTFTLQDFFQAHLIQQPSIYRGHNAGVISWAFQVNTSFLHLLQLFLLLCEFKDMLKFELAVFVL